MSRFSRIINVEDLKINTLENAPGKSIAANFVAKTFIYTGDETGGGAGAGAGKPGGPGRAPGQPPAAAKAQGLKARAEGRGVE